MTSLVLELQRDALDSAVPITQLLRKALVVARKLEVREMRQWIESELRGYAVDCDIPEYRELVGQLKGWNPYQGWQSIIIQDLEIAELITHQKTKQNIAEIEHILSVDQKDGSVHMPFSGRKRKMICDAIGVETEVTLMISEAALAGIIDAVRNTVLEWALQLEKEGVLGQGMVFSESEKSSVSKNTYNVSNYYGDLHGNQISQSSPGSYQSQNSNLDLKAFAAFIAAIEPRIPELALDEHKLRVVEAEIATLKAQLGSPKPNATILSEGLGTIRRIFEGASGGVGAELLMHISSLV